MENLKIVQNTPCTRCQNFSDFMLFRKKTFKNTPKSWYKHEKMWSDVQKPLNIGLNKRFQNFQILLFAKNNIKKAHGNEEKWTLTGSSAAKGDDW